MDKIFEGLQELELQSSGTCDTLLIDDVKEYILMSKRKDVLKRHNKVITPPKKEGGKWMTWIDTPNEEKPRRKIVKNTEEDIINALYEHYFAGVNVVTIESYYPIWFDFKKSCTASTSTLRRHDQHYKKYYENTPIVKKPLKELTSMEITKWANDIIRKHDLSSREFQNMKIIMTGILNLAKQNKIIYNNPWDEVTVNKRLFRVVHKKPNSQRVFIDNELADLQAELIKQLEEKPECSAPYAVMLMTKISPRIGEIMALKFSDIEGDYIHIQRMERKFDVRLEDGTWGKQYYDVVDHVKTHNDVGERFLYLTTTAREIIEQVRKLNEKYGYSDDDYIFVDARGRMNSSQVAGRLRRWVKHIGVSESKGSHAIRRTVASILSANNVPLDEIRRFLGHSDERTTLSYIYNPYGAEKTENLIENALK